MTGAIALLIAVGIVCAFGFAWVIDLVGSDRGSRRRGVPPVVGVVLWRTVVLLAKASFQVIKWSLVFTLAIFIGALSGLFKVNTSPPSQR